MGVRGGGGGGGGGGEAGAEYLCDLVETEAREVLRGEGGW